VCVCVCVFVWVGGWVGGWAGSRVRVSVSAPCYVCSSDARAEPAVCRPPGYCASTGRCVSLGLLELCMSRARAWEYTRMYVITLAGPRLLGLFVIRHSKKHSRSLAGVLSSRPINALRMSLPGLTAGNAGKCHNSHASFCRVPIGLPCGRLNVRSLFPPRHGYSRPHPCACTVGAAAIHVRRVH
jgi:hypothetical protein